MFGYFSTHCLCAVANKKNVLCHLLLGTHSTFFVSACQSITAGEMGLTVRLPRLRARQLR